MMAIIMTGGNELLNIPTVFFSPVPFPPVSKRDIEIKASVSVNTNCIKKLLFSYDSFNVTRSGVE